MTTGINCLFVRSAGLPKREETMVTKTREDVCERFTMGERVREMVEGKMEKISANIQGIEGKLKKQNISRDRRICLEFHLQRARQALYRCQDDINDLMRI